MRVERTSTTPVVSHPTSTQGAATRRGALPSKAARSPDQQSQISRPARFRELLDQPADERRQLLAEDLATALGASPGQPGLPAPSGPPLRTGAVGAPSHVSASAPGPQAGLQPEALGPGARDVRLATDGGDLYLLRFEVAEGALRGTRFAVSAHAGVVSAVAITAAPELALRLERVLEEVRTSLHEKGVAVGEMEVRAGSDGRREQGARPCEPPQPDPPPSCESGHRPPALPGDGLDYFI